MKPPPIAFLPLTTVRQDEEAVGRCAAELMLKRLKDREAPVRHERLPVELVIRDSTAAPATA